jgi:hypothetical protein
MLTDDPIAIVLHAVFLLAAGMYPLGFMFGVCSGCCGCAPCNDCIHRFKGGNINAPSEQFGCTAPVDITITTPDGSVTFENYRIEFEDVRTITTLSCGEVLKLRQISQIFPAPLDECGCFGCGYQPILKIGTREYSFQNDLFLGSCSDTSDSITQTFSYDGQVPCDFDVTVTIETEPCECGACCYEDGTCNPDTPEFYCEDPVGFYGVRQGTWQGVGTDCDPNPCES